MGGQPLTASRWRQSQRLLALSTFGLSAISCAFLLPLQSRQHVVAQESLENAGVTALYHSAVATDWQGQGQWPGLWSSPCLADNKDVKELRKTTWPLKDPRSVPIISKVIYINLDWDRKRREYMENQLTDLRRHIRHSSSGYELQWERLSAVTGDDMRESERFADWRSKGFSKTSNPDVDGKWKIASCSYSHYEAVAMVYRMKEELLKKDELVLIVEDDVQIVKDLPDAWAELWPYLPQEWDILRVGWFGDVQNCSQVVNKRIDRAGWRMIQDDTCMYCGMQGYLVRPDRAIHVLNRFEASKMTHSDTIMGAPTPPLEDEAKIPPLQIYTVRPRLARTHTDKEGYPEFPSDRRDNDVTH